LNSAGKSVPKPLCPNGKYWNGTQCVPIPCPICPQGSHCVIDIWSPASPTAPTAHCVATPLQP
jgi:hypothetical protein